VMESYARVFLDSYPLVKRRGCVFLTHKACRILEGHLTLCRNSRVWDGITTRLIKDPLTGCGRGVIGLGQRGPARPGGGKAVRVPACPAPGASRVGGGPWI
jgi:hypothetical protein